MIFDELSNAACRLSLGGPGAELEGGVFKHPPPPARRRWRRAPARRGLWKFVLTRLLVWGGGNQPPSVVFSALYRKPLELQFGDFSGTFIGDIVYKF